MTSDETLVAAVRDGLAALADPVRASSMQAYMKSAMPYRGVPTPARRRLVRAVLAERMPSDRMTWEATVRDLWDRAAYREERYVAVDVCRHRSARHWQDPATVGLYDHLVVSGAWWDYVDAVAIALLGPILRSDPKELAPVVRRWAVDDDMWRRRSSLIIQIGSKSATDVDLLADVVTANLDGHVFFIRKAIGWALRDYARTDPGWVRSFVDRTDGLSPLARREATKHLGYDAGAERVRRNAMSDERPHGPHRSPHAWRGISHER